MIPNKENEKPSPSTYPSYSPMLITHLKFLLIFPPQNSCTIFPSDANINKPTLPENGLLWLSSWSSSLLLPWETMRRRPRTTFLVSLIALLTFTTFSLYLSRNAISTWRPDTDLLPNVNTNNLVIRNNTTTTNNIVVHELTHQTRRVSSIKDTLPAVSVLIPDWEILVIVAPNTPLSSSYQHHCLFPNNARSPAKFAGVLPFTNRTTFKCDMPESVLHRRMFSQPTLVTEASDEEFPAPAPPLPRWNFLVYESFSTENDVVVFAKGVNHRQGNPRSPNELRCVFDLGSKKVRNVVTSSAQEVFRCPHPNPSELGLDSYDDLRQRIGITLEIVADKITAPSVAYYIPRPEPKPKPNAIALSTGQARPKHFLCACTMVYNVAKVLREWVMYHAKVGVDNFILYDNGSDDDFYSVVEELRSEGYNISTVFWIWPKTQEAGFSHSVVYSQSKGLCTWIMYVDVDEFAFSPSWGGKNNLKSVVRVPSLKTLLRREQKRNGKVGQVSMRCLEFGPSGQRWHPAEGVTQGYTCRRRGEQRHKSAVLVEGVDPSLWNVIHHFRVNEGSGFGSKQVSVEEGLVNHYKYQAWDEFKSKFRRRVSAYVVDWTQAVNPESKDRTPGLGFQPIEPKDWSHRFCEVRDYRLKSFTRAWFGSLTPNGYTMPWQTQTS
ncbi:hypothetical protein Fmac_000175 [Flemingia macrophylla]|uniref:Glycosyltransferase family 92 protein n=1 Tax=Flemingia macrophylla TaxID=520843 RepID=A0ABD1NGD4_9FABA